MPRRFPNEAYDACRSTKCFLDFLRYRRQLRNNAQKIIFDFLFAWLAAHQKIIRADMEDAGKAKRSCCGYQELTNLQNIQACLDAVCRVAHESEIGFTVVIVRNCRLTVVQQRIWKKKGLTNLLIWIKRLDLLSNLKGKLKKRKNNYARQILKRKRPNRSGRRF